MTKAVVRGITLANVYADNYESCLNFYRDVLGMTDISVMNDHSCYISINEDQGMYLVGGFSKLKREARQSGCSFALEVEDINNCFQAVRSSGAQCLQDEPVQMNDTTWWFQCCDPADNIIEFLGPKSNA